MTIQDVLKEMREYGADGGSGYNPDIVYVWADAIEAAMREPVAETWQAVIDRIAPVMEILSDHDEEMYPAEAALALDRARIRRELAALPPDAAGEITVLREDKERLMDRIDGCHQAMRKKDAEIERLWALFSHWYEMWNDGIPNPDGDVLDDTVAALDGKEDV